jgi:hypothetical protein
MITNAQVQTLLTAVRDGVDIRHAGALAHISDSSLSRFLNHPENDRQAAIGTQVREAQAEYLREAVAGITATGARGFEWVLSHSPTYRGDYGERTPDDTGALAGLGQLFAALTGAASTEPPRLGSAGLPLLEEVREVEVREVEEEAGSNSEHQEQQ